MAPELPRRLYYGSLQTLRLGALSRSLRHAGLILCYHNVVAGPEAAIGDPGLHLPRERFERQMRWLAARYTVVGLRDFVDRLTSGRSLRSVAAITFDDGYAGVFDHAVPILRALNLPATVFIVTEAAGGEGFWWDAPLIVEHPGPAARCGWPDGMLPPSHRPAGWDTIRTLRGGGIEIGAHSATHGVLPALSDTELEYEIDASRTTVYRMTGSWPEFFAYPYGRWDARVRDCVRSAGYRAGLTLDRGLNGSHVDPWSLRRVNVPASISDAAFEAWAGGL